MTIVHEYDELRGAIDLALSVDEEAMIEAFIEGTELTVGVIGNDDPRALPVTSKSYPLKMSSITSMRSMLKAAANICAPLRFPRRQPKLCRSSRLRHIRFWVAAAFPATT